MWLILLSPLVALFIDYLRNKFSISNLWMIPLLLIVTLPTLVIWLAGYSYSGTLGNYVGITLFISGFIAAIFLYDDGATRSKIKSSIILIIVLGLFILLYLISSIFSQRTSETFTTIKVQDYKAIHSRDFDLVLDGLERVTIKKTRLYGLIERTIFNETLSNQDTIPNCTLHLSDRSRKISFNYCKSILTVEK